METVDLLLDEDNELTFKVVVEGTRDSSVKVRFVLEDKDLDYTFPAHSVSDGEVTVNLPPMKKHLKEGSYEARLEVIAEDRYFEPLRFGVDMKNNIQVSEVSIVQINESKKPKKVQVPTSASASIITAKKRDNSKLSIREAAKQLESQEVTEEKSPKSVTESQVRNLIKELLKSKDH